MEIDKATVAARIRGEQQRTLGNIAARTERPAMAYWLSFADNDGFRGAVIVHANDFTEALMEATLHGINPHGECQGMQIPATKAVKIPEHWKYRLLSKADCLHFDAEMAKVSR